jgi:hypothetical protein
VIQEMETKEKKMKRKLILADIKENAWKIRGKKSSHEEYADRLEKETKKVERGKVRDRIQNLENMKRIKEEKEIERRKSFMVNWKEEEKRKRKEKTIQEGWKNLMESVANWEEIDETELEYSEENLCAWFSENWTQEGVAEAGNIIEEILSEVIAFAELKEKLSGTVQTNYSNHQKTLKTDEKLNLLHDAQLRDKLKWKNGQTEVGTNTENSNMKLFGVTVPPDRKLELENTMQEILRLENLISTLGNRKPYTGTVPPDKCEMSQVSAVPPDIGNAKSTRKKNFKHFKKKSFARKGVEPEGENKLIWKSQWEIRKMFEKGKLLRVTVPPTKTVKQPTVELKQNLKNFMSATPGIVEKEGNLVSQSMKNQCQSSTSGKVNLKNFENKKTVPKNTKNPKNPKISSMLRIWEEKTNIVENNVNPLRFCRPINSESQLRVRVSHLHPVDNQHGGD